MTSASAGSKEKKPRGHFSELLKVEGKLALREPTGIGYGNRCSNHLLVSIRPHWNSIARERRQHELHSPGSIRPSNHGHCIHLPGGQYLACHACEVSGDGVAAESFSDPSASLETTRSSVDRLTSRSPWLQS